MGVLRFTGRRRVQEGNDAMVGLKVSTVIYVYLN
jgi:hypothetical protein